MSKLVEPEELNTPQEVPYTLEEKHEHESPLKHFCDITNPTVSTQQNQIAIFLGKKTLLHRKIQRIKSHMHKLKLQQHKIQVKWSNVPTHTAGLTADNETLTTRLSRTLFLQWMHIPVLSFLFPPDDGALCLFFLFTY